MSLYQCEQCGAKENTAVGAYWGREKKICSQCDTGVWHNRFPRIVLPMGMFKTNKEGNLAHIETGDTDVKKYAISAGKENNNET